MTCTPCEERKRAREARIEARRRGVSPPASASAARSVHARIAALEASSLAKNGFLVLVALSLIRLSRGRSDGEYEEALDLLRMARILL